MARALEEARAMQISLQPHASLIKGVPPPLGDDEAELEIASRFVLGEDLLTLSKLNQVQAGDPPLLTTSQNWQKKSANYFWMSLVTVHCLENTQGAQKFVAPMVWQKFG